MDGIRLFAHVLAFDLQQRVRNRWAAVTLLAMLGFGGLTAYTFADGETGALSPGLLSGGYKATQALMAMLLLAMFPLALSAADFVRRDHDARMAELVHATPAPDWLILLARFVAQMLIGLGSVLAGVVGYEIGARMPWISPGLSGAVPWRAWTSAFCILAVPTVAAVSSTAMCVASATQNRFASWVLPLAFWMLTPVAVMAAARGFTTLGPVIDPIGTTAVLAATLTLTPAEQQTWHVGFSSLMQNNRVFWLTVSALALALASAIVSRRSGTVWFPALQALAGTHAWWRFPLTLRVDAAAPPLPSSPSRAVSMPRLRVGKRQLSDLSIFWSRTRFELGGILRSFLTLLFIALPLLSVIPVLLFGGSSEADTQVLLPVSAIVVPKLEDAVFAATLIFTVLFAGEMMWRERQASMHELIEAAGAPVFTVIGSKLAALAIIVGLQFVLVCLIGIGWQLTHGAPQLNISHYLAHFFLVDWTAALMGAAMAMLVHAIVPHRTAGHILALGAVMCFGSMDEVGIEHNLLIFGGVPKVPLSDMNGLGHYLLPAAWFVLYWSLVSALLVLLAELIRDRGLGAPLLDRLRSVRAAPLAIRRAMVAALGGAVIAGSVIFWNTNIRNTYVNSARIERERVAYERVFGSHATLPQPRISGLDVTLDLQPHRRAYQVRGEMTLRNPSAEAISKFFVEAQSPNLRLTAAGAAKIHMPDPKCCRVFEVLLATPLLPGQELKLAFEDRQSALGRWNGEEFGVQGNGTRLDAHDVAPVIGIHHRRFLADEAKREKRGLPKLKDAPGGGGRSQQAFYSLDSDSMKFAITVSTEPDQTAVAPGRLVRTWDEGKRKYFRYEIDTPVDSTWTVTSARYVTTEDAWRGTPLYVHHHKTHHANVGQMLEGMKLALDYCSNSFSPYQFKELRLVEYPYSGSISATAQPGFIAYSEMAGFISDTSSPSSDRLRIAYVTSHEVAHQWWGYQIAPANKPGAIVLSESLAEYTAIMVQRKRNGAAMSRGQIARGREAYLRARKDATEEQPLVNMEQTSPASFFYHKGSAAFYALMEQVGEASMNKALARFIKEFGGKQDPYPSTQDLVAIFKQEFGPRHHTLISDLFERVTFWSFQIMSAKAEALPDGSWRTTLSVNARKYEADAKGKEQQLPLDQRVPVSVYDADPGEEHGKRFETALVSLRSGTQSVSLTSKLQPRFVRINPSRALMQRNIDKTTLAVAQ